MSDPNEKYFLKLGGPPLRILLSKKPVSALQASQDTDQQETESERNKGIRLRPRPLDSIIPKTGGFINFWDLGQVSDGMAGWVDIDYHSLTMASVVLGTYPADPIDVHSEIYSTEWDALRDLLFVPAIADWPTTYRPLTYEEIENYGVAVVLDSGEKYLGTPGSTIFGQPANGWTANGLPASGDNFELRPGIAFQPFGNDPSVYRVTNDPTYASTEVSFTLSKKGANVFLVPSLLNTYSETGSDIYADHDTEFYFDATRAASRQFWLGRSDTAFSGLGSTLFSSKRAPYTSGGSIYFPSPTNVTDWIAYMNADPDARAFLAVDGGSFGERVYTEIAAGTFPDVTVPPMGQYVLTVLGQRTSGRVTTYYGTMADNLADKRPEGILAGVIVQDGTTYYFWTKEDLTGSLATSFPTVGMLFRY